MISKYNIIKIVSLLFAMLFLTGCSDKGNIAESNGGQILINEEVVSLDELRNDSATAELPNNLGTAEFKVCSGLDSCESNTLHINVEDMTKYKKGTYFTMYLGTKVVVHYPYKKELIEGSVTIDTPGAMESAALAQFLYDRCEKLRFGEYNKTIFKDKGIVNVANNSFCVRPEEIVIPGILRVALGVKDCTEPSMIGETSVMKGSSSKYDFYQVGDIYIQVIQGTDINSFISLR